jgi:hypothetical protein
VYPKREGLVDAKLHFGFHVNMSLEGDGV